MESTSFIINSDYISVKQSTVVTLEEDFQLLTEDGVIVIKATIECDFQEIPQKYHEVALNILTSKYINKVSFGDNPFSKCKPLPKRRWYEFWKAKYL